VDELPFLYSPLPGVSILKKRGYNGGVMTIKEEKLSTFERLSLRITNWVGTTSSILAHSLFFMGCFLFVLLGTPLEKVLLVLTTVVSLEAIYLSIFIQMTVNRNTKSLEEVEEDIDEIEEDIGNIHEEVEDISEDVEEISEDVEEISEELQEDETEETQRQGAFEKIERDLQKLLADIEALKNEKSS
jgi:low affinity Fe/Cu permease